MIIQMISTDGELVKFALGKSSGQLGIYIGSQDNFGTIIKKEDVIRLLEMLGGE